MTSRDESTSGPFAERHFRTVCTGCGKELGPAYSPFCPDCNSMADVEYDLDRAKLYESTNPFVRFADLIPVHDRDLLPADATGTRTVHAERLGEHAGIPWLYLKDETLLPTGTTKDRMAAVALAYLFEHGVRAFCTSSTGNSSTAMAHGIVRIPGFSMYLFTAEQFADRVDAPDSDQIVNFVLHDATFVEAFDAARDYAIANGLSSERGFFNPGRREGLKLAWLEGVDQVPRPIDWYVQAVSSAMGVYGVAGGAEQLLAMGHIDRLPHLLCVQQDTCAPMVTAWEAGSERIRPEDIVDRPVGIAKAILRGNPTMAYPPVRERVVRFGGSFIAVSEQEIRAAHDLVEELEGITACFNSAAAVAGALKARARGDISPDETVLVNLTGREPTERGAVRNPRWLHRTASGWEPDEDSA